MQQFLDRSVIAGVSRRESDGALVADARVTRTGVQVYLGSEVDPKNEHGYRGKTVRVYRPGDEVFSVDTMASIAHRPVTNDHPPVMVNKDNWRKYAVGNTVDEVKGEGIYLRVPLIVSDGDTITAIEEGKRELSAGYWCVLDWTPGVTPGGETYDAVQRDIRFNHVAVVQRGRAGSAVRIGDEAAIWDTVPEETGEDKGDHTMSNTKQVTVDGITIEVTDQGAQVIAKLQATIDSLNTKITESDRRSAEVAAEHDQKLAAKDAEIDDLKSKVLDAAALDQMVANRAKLVSDARLVAKDVKVDGLTDAEIRRATVVAALGDAAVKDKSDDYVSARFDILVEDSGKSKDTFRDAMRAHDARPGDDPLDKNRQEYLASLQDAWKTQAAS